MKKLLAFMLVFLLIVAASINVFAQNPINSEAEEYKISRANIDVSSKSAVLMEAETGEIIFCKNENEARSPASVTKIMTLLLVMEALKEERISLDSVVPISANAASMGGSQVFLEEGEEFTVRELIKCTVIASANDAAVALSEYIYGSESTFVSAMNDRAKELGMKNTNFENTTGLDDTTVNHVTSALDIAIMSRELLKHSLIFEYSSLWQDTIRNGEFTLTNTNRLVRYYDGCNGLKTGSTDKAGYCISATAKRDGMQLIAVVMGADTRDERNFIARSLLDFGFANYALYTEEEAVVDNIKVYGGNVEATTIYSGKICKLINKNHKNKVEKYYEIPDYISAPLSDGDSVGKIRYIIDGKLLSEENLYITSAVEAIGIGDIFVEVLRAVFTGKIKK